MSLLYGLDIVPIRWAGKLRFVALDDIPEPFRQQFLKALLGSGCPGIEGFGQCAYAQDWIDWASGVWRWGGVPTPAEVVSK
jgi:hypothetical protein